MNDSEIQFPMLLKIYLNYKEFFYQFKQPSGNFDMNFCAVLISPKLFNSTANSLLSLRNIPERQYRRVRPRLKVNCVRVQLFDRAMRIDAPIRLLRSTRISLLLNKS